MPRLYQAVKRLRPVAAKMRPFAKKTRKVARERLHLGRAWAAPRVERSGHVLQETVAPRVSSLLTSAARLIEPGTPGSGTVGGETVAGGGATAGGDTATPITGDDGQEGSEAEARSLTGSS